MQASTKSTREIWLSRIILAVIVLLGALLRLYGISSISLWYDDFQSVVYLGAPAWKTYLALVRMLNPDHVPLYFLLQYAWAQVAGTGVLAIRLLSVIAGLAAIPLLYVFSKELWGRQAGLLAALLLALSPLHIWYSQALRYTVFIDSLSLISTYALVRAVRGNRWSAWGLHLIVNMALIWTHLLTVLLAGVQFVYLLTVFRRITLRMFALAAIQGLTLAAALLWLNDSRPYTISSEEDYYGLNGQIVLVDLLADDATSLSHAWMYFSSPSRHITRSPYAPDGLLSGWGLFNLGLMAFFAAAILSVGLRLVLRVLLAWRAKESGDHDKDFELRQDAESFLLLIYLIFLPVAVLVTLSCVMRPVLMPQYTMYSSLALYVMAGAAFAGLRKGWLRKVFLCVVFLLYGYQLAIMLPEKTRTDWRGAAEEVRMHVTPDDLVLVRGRFFSTETFRFVLGAQDVPVASGYTLQSICEKSNRYLRGAAPASAHADVCKAVWAVIEVAFDYPPLPLSRFENCLKSRGLAFRRKDFPGMGGVAVYRISVDTQEAPPTEKFLNMDADLDYAGLSVELLLPKGNPTTEQENVKALQRTVEAAPPRGWFTYTLFAFELADEGCYDVAEAAARKAIDLSPKSSFAFFALAVTLGGKGDLPGASEVFASAMRLDRIGVMVIYQPLFRALYEEPNPTKARTELARLDAMGAFVPQSMRMAAGQLPCLAALRTCP